MESWYSSTENEEITLFHMDNDKLVATHYCGVGIQATMELEWPTEENDTIEFKVKSTTNLASPDTWHNSGFVYAFSDNAVSRKEIWSKAGETSESHLTLVKK